MTCPWCGWKHYAEDRQELRPNEVIFSIQYTSSLGCTEKVCMRCQLGLNRVEGRPLTSQVGPSWVFVHRDLESTSLRSEDILMGNLGVQREER